MSIKRVQAKNGNQYCRYGDCKDGRVPATWRNWHNGLPHPFACDAHKRELETPADDGYMTMADEMTWGRL